MNIIGHKKISLGISSVLVIASIFMIFMFGFQLGIDFTGGTLWQIKFKDTKITKTELNEYFLLKGETGASVTAASGESFLIRLKEIDEAMHQALLSDVKNKFGDLEELQFETIGSTIGEEVQSRAITAFILVLITISLYVAFVFRKVSKPVSSWKYGIIALVTLFHDAIIPTGLMVVLRRFIHVEIDTNFIVAILVVIGFSIHDTIVVFDRIRENLILKKDTREKFEDIVNLSVNQTIVRSLNTSLTLVVVLVALLFLGSASLTNFILVILAGTIIGTYSSILVASPLLTLWKGNNKS
ncbi:MAG: protein translocase subunit SecF [Candidatus Harrisonbacteria bacterium CG10_big_fil_rev_8_21_14_0_10_42_17]|uniref:Protein-export membrane protein SecF n=1 Tax=Candidatus Harrisonbacteria bacterium CG10_big_fil_rev_8_21_14_0_10_42_17 TaxID=1974584 RepID=A0A2M6WHZ9_9BACT|nr:MAG: protein translocase subunit SecF [Candidatus Harrisonbacteria bacterium CG10_big_fil_rev_8_21_14_0_10_42_17]